MTITTDPKHPGLNKAKDDGQDEAYLVGSASARSVPVRPFRDTYVHRICSHQTRMDRLIAETYAANPKFYSHTFCIHCRKHFPVGEFSWLDGSTVGS